MKSWFFLNHSYDYKHTTAPMHLNSQNLTMPSLTDHILDSRDVQLHCHNHIYHCDYGQAWMVCEHELLPMPQALVGKDYSKHFF